MDDQGYFSLEWKEWLLNPQFLSLVIGAPIDVIYGGACNATRSTRGIMLGQGTDPVVVTAAMTNGQILIGQTGDDPLPKTVTGDMTLSATGFATVLPTANNILANDVFGRRPISIPQEAVVYNSAQNILATQVFGG